MLYNWYVLWSNCFYIKDFYFNSTIQIDRIASKWFGSAWLGVYALDKLPNYIPVKSFLIVNTHTSNLRGEHWIAVYNKPAQILVFDPLAFYYPSMLVTHLSKISKQIVYNKIQYQDPFTTTCVQRCLLWLKKKQRYIWQYLFVFVVKKNKCILLKRNLCYLLKLRVKWIK